MKRLILCLVFLCLSLLGQVYMPYKYTGTITLRYSNKKIEEIRKYKDGKYDGIWTYYDYSGIKIMEGTFKDGKKDGSWKIWDIDGTLRYEIYYSLGIRTGTWRSWNANGVIMREKKY